MKRHPSRFDLLAYAESLVDGHTLSAQTAKHLSGCASCKAEVEAIRQSLAFANHSKPLEPSDAFTRGILQAARTERHTLQQRRALRSVAGVLKGAACAAGIVIVAAVSFGAALTSESWRDAGTRRTPAAVMVRTTDNSPSPELLRTATARIDTLAAAVSAPSATPSLWEIEQRRAASALSADLAAAKAALERNPGCARASRVVNNNLERLPRTLKALYLERSL
jgi:hypothetical protein